MEWLVAVVTVCAAVVTIVWFLRDIKKENSKVLKAILNVEEKQTELLAKVEEGQRKGFLALEQGLIKMEEGLMKMEEGQRRGLETLAQLLVKAKVG
jgi:hypothetical protein